MRANELQFLQTAAQERSENSGTCQGRRSPQLHTPPKAVFAKYSGCSLLLQYTKKRSSRLFCPLLRRALCCVLHNALLVCAHYC